MQWCNTNCPWKVLFRLQHREISFLWLYKHAALKQLLFESESRFPSRVSSCSLSAKPFLLFGYLVSERHLILLELLQLVAIIDSLHWKRRHWQETEALNLGFLLPDQVERSRASTVNRGSCFPGCSSGSTSSSYIQPVSVTLFTEIYNNFRFTPSTSFSAKQIVSASYPCVVAASDQTPTSRTSPGCINNNMQKVGTRTLPWSDWCKGRVVHCDE